MSELTIFAGLEALEPGEPLTTDGSQFTGRDRVTIDQWLSQTVRHRHTGNAAIPNPTNPMTIVGLSSGGTIPTETEVFVTFTVVDAFGGETAAAPEVTASTPAGIGEPASALTCVIDNSHGQLTINSYQYVYTLTDATGGESEISPVVTVDRLSGPASAAAVFSGMLAILAANPTATGWRQYRSTGGSQYCLLGSPQGMVDGFVDDGTISVDYGTQPPSDDTTNQTGALSVTLPPGAASAGASFNVYVSTQSETYTSPSLYGSFPASEAGTPILITSLATQSGSPPPVATTVSGAHQIDPDTELLNWHWRNPVALVAALPSGGQGDVRLVYGASAIYGVLGAGAAGPGDWTELVNPAGGGGGSASLVVLASGGLGAFISAAGDTITLHLGASPTTPFDPSVLQGEVNALAAEEGYLASAVSGLGTASAAASAAISGLSSEVTVLMSSSGNVAAEITALAVASAVEAAEIVALSVASALVPAEVAALGVASAAASGAITVNALHDVVQDAEILALGLASGLVATHQAVQDAELTALALASTGFQTHQNVQDAELTALALGSTGLNAEVVILMAASAAGGAGVDALARAEIAILGIASAGASAQISLEQREINALAAASAAAAVAITALDADLGELSFLDGEVTVLMAAQKTAGFTASAQAGAPAFVPASGGALIVVGSGAASTSISHVGGSAIVTIFAPVAPIAGASFAQTFGDGSSLVYTITHNLGSRDLTAEVYEAAGSFRVTGCTIAFPTVNTCTLTFASAPSLNQYRVVIQSGGTSSVGPQGIQGIQGPTGSGVQGIQGIQGPTGSGVQGQPGPAGGPFYTSASVGGSGAINELIFVGSGGLGVTLGGASAVGSGLVTIAAIPLADFASAAVPTVQNGMVVSSPGVARIVKAVYVGDGAHGSPSTSHIFIRHNLGTQQLVVSGQWGANFGSTGMWQPFDVAWTSANDVNQIQVSFAQALPAGIPIFITIIG